MKKTKKSFRKQLMVGIIKSGIVSFSLAVVITFGAFFPFLQRNAITAAENMNTKILQHMESVLDYSEKYMENIAVTIEQNIDIQEYFRNPTVTNKTSASVRLNNFSSYMELIRGIVVATDEVPLIDSMINLSNDDYQLLESEYFQDMRVHSFGRSYSDVYQTTIGYKPFCTVAYARNFYLNNRWTTIVMFVNLNNALSDVQNMAEGVLDAYYLTDDKGQKFLSVGNENEIKTISETAAELDFGENGSVFGDIIFTKKSATSGYGIESMVRRFSVLSLLLPYSVGLFLAMFICLLLILFITSRNVNSMISPVIELSSHMLQAASGDLSCKIETDREDEIGQLERSFNKMIDDLKHSIDVISEKESREQKIRFSLLVSQIDPHFIYNTINSVNYLARKERYQDIVKVNSALCSILRDRLRVNDIQIADTIAKEIHVVSQYITIEKYMYGGNLEVQWDVDAELMEKQIPKNMIQPLVENALFHGLISEESGELNGLLTISLKLNDCGNIILQVKDNGFGMDADRLEQVKKEQFTPEDRGSRIGLSNIRGRLFYLYNNQDCIEIESEINKGTCITITFLDKEIKAI